MFFGFVYFYEKPYSKTLNITCTNIDSFNENDENKRLFYKYVHQNTGVIGRIIVKYRASISCLVNRFGEPCI